MGILEKNKKSKGTAFVYDENNDYYKMEINGIEFVCDSVHSDYEKRAVELAQAYEKRLPDIVDYLMPDIKEMFGITIPEVIIGLSRHEKDLVLLMDQEPMEYVQKQNWMTW